MKLPNRIENLIIATVIAALTFTAVYYLKIQPLEREIEAQRQMIMQLALVEKYKYEIKNDFDRIKAKEGQVVLQLDNQIDASRVRLDTIKIDTTIINTPKKKGLLKKLFNK
jgi:hypothetical protein